MQPKHFFKFLSPLALVLVLVSCGGGSSPETPAVSSVVPKSDPFWDSWVTPQPDKTPMVEQGKELSDPFKKS